MFSCIRLLNAKRRRLFGMAVGMVVFAISMLPAVCSGNQKYDFSEEDYERVTASRQLISAAATSAAKKRIAVEIELAERRLNTFRNMAVMPDSRTNDIGGTRLVSNMKQREDGERGIKKTEEQIAMLKRELLIAGARAEEFDKARARGFIPIRNGAGQERKISPVGIKNGQLLFITDDLGFYAFPLDDIQYGTLAEAVRFLNKYMVEGSYVLEDSLKVPETLFSEKIASLDININRRRQMENAPFIALRPPTDVDAGQKAADVEAMRSMAGDLQKMESRDGSTGWWARLEEEAERTNSPELCRLLADGYLKDGHNFEKARKWAERAARQNYSPAYVTLGNSYNEDYLLQCGFKSDEIGATSYDIAREWYEKGVEKREPGAYWELGKMYLFGRGVPVNDRRGAEYIRNAAYSTDKIFGQQACFMMALMHYYGKGTEKNHAQAIDWLKASMSLNPDTGTGKKAKEFLRTNSFEVAQ